MEAFFVILSINLQKRDFPVICDHLRLLVMGAILSDSIENQFLRKIDPLRSISLSTKPVRKCYCGGLSRCGNSFGDLLVLVLVLVMCLLVDLYTETFIWRPTWRRLRESSRKDCWLIALRNGQRRICLRTGNELELLNSQSVMDNFTINGHRNTWNMFLCCLTWGGMIRFSILLSRVCCCCCCCCCFF